MVLGGRSRPQGAGQVWLVGAGPGDPELLTIKALKALQAAEVVVHDGLVSDEILDLGPPAARRISVAKRKSRHSYSQDEINRMLVAFGRKPGGLDFKAIDEQPVHNIFLIVAPPLEVSNQYLPVLGKIAQFSKEPDVATRLREIDSPRDFIALLEEKGI